jgi:hypothetical protein
VLSVMRVLRLNIKRIKLAHLQFKDAHTNLVRSTIKILGDKIVRYHNSIVNIFKVVWLS